MRTATDVIEFVLFEVVRYVERINTLPVEQVFEGPGDGLFSLPDAAGRNMYLIGRKAELELRALCERELAESEYSGRIDLGALLRQFKQEIANRFITQACDLDDDTARTAFVAALSVSLKRIRNLTHYVPCHLVVANHPDTVRFGPVTFMRREVVWPKIARALDIHFESADDNGRALRPHIKRYYSEFSWIAEVEVVGREPKPSREASLQMVQTALDGLQLLIGGDRLHHMSVGGIAIRRDARSHIVFADGKIESVQVTHHSTAAGMGMQEETWKRIDDDAVINLRRLIGLVINYAYAVPVPTPFALRMADALHWFGLAARDTSAGAKLVMFLTAVERVLAPRKKRIETDVRNRSLIFCSPDNHGHRMGTIYRVRGELSHGKLSPGSSEVAEAASMAQEFAEQVLLGILRQCEEVLPWNEHTAEQLGTALDGAYEQFNQTQKAAAATRSNLDLNCD